MNSMGRFRTLISKGVSSVSTPFHPFGGAVDLIVIKQKDGSYKSTPWYVRFGKFQGVLKRTEEFVRIHVDGVEANFHMHLTKSGEAFFVKGVRPSEDSVASGNSEDCEPGVHSPNIEQTSIWESGSESPLQQFTMTNIPTSEQIASLNLKDGQNMITFSFTTRVLGTQQIHAHVYLWKWNSHIVISDVDGTITRSNALGQVMHLVGKDWTQSGVARLFSAIKENGYQLLFLSARAIAQAYLTRSFLFGVNQDGETIPYGPVVTSPDGLFPSLYREVIRRNPHEFKISCLEDIRRLFPSDHNPFYGGFGNRDTDKVSYMKMGIPEGRIFTINPKGEVVNCGRTDVKCYTSLHTLVHEMFPPIPSDEKPKVTYTTRRLVMQY